MAWASGGTPNSSYSTDLQLLFVFGSTDAGKNLVTGTSYTVTTNGTSYGTDSIGSYVATGGSSSQRLQLDVSGAGVSDDGDPLSFMIVFSRSTGTQADWVRLVETTTSGGGLPMHRLLRNGSSTTDMRVDLSGGQTVAYNPIGMTVDTEFAFVVTRSGTTAKLFYTGGGAALTPAADTYNSGTIAGLFIGGSPSGEAYIGRFRCYAMWTRALSDTDAQALADNPQNVLSQPAPTAPSGVTAGSITTTGATISWTDASSDETGFKVQTAPSPFSSWTTASGSPTAANATSLAVTGLSSSTTYKARVASTNANGDSAWVESGEFTTTGGQKGRALLLGVG